MDTKMIMKSKINNEIKSDIKSETDSLYGKILYKLHTLNPFLCFIINFVLIPFVILSLVTVSTFVVTFPIALLMGYI